MRAPDCRVSRPTTNGRSVPMTVAATRPSVVISSGVRSRSASPRMPSVPKRMIGSGLTLRVLRRLAGLLEAVLAALLLPRVTREETRLLQLRAQLVVEADESPGD